MMSLRQSAVVLRRCFSVNTPAAAAAADPIQVRQQKILGVILILICLQSLFVDKIREYGDKKSKSGGKLVEATKATEADLQAELDKVISIFFDT